MTRYGNRILIVFLPVLFLGLLPAQQRVQETRLLNVQPTGKGFRGAGFWVRRFSPTLDFTKALESTCFASKESEK